MKRRGKPQLGGNEARKFLERALESSDQVSGNGQESIAVFAAAVALLLGLRSHEIVQRQVRDLDDNGTVFWVPTSKTEAGVRRVEVPEVIRDRLVRLTDGRALTDPLFPGLTCEGLRGTNATISMRANDNPHSWLRRSVTRASGSPSGTTPTWNR